MNKTLASILIATALGSVAHADLIDLTPGGFQPINPPPVYVDWLIHDWGHSAFPLPDSLFTVTGISQPNGTISWNLDGTGYRFNWLFVIDTAGAMDMYRVSGDQILLGEGVITVNGIDNITAISAYGMLPGQVPDSGGTLFLSAIGLALLIVTIKWKLI